MYRKPLTTDQQGPGSFTQHFSGCLLALQFKTADPGPHVMWALGSGWLSSIPALTPDLAECRWGFQVVQPPGMSSTGPCQPVGSQASTCRRPRTRAEAGVRCTGPVFQWTTGMGVVERGDAAPGMYQEGGSGSASGCGGAEAGVPSYRSPDACSHARALHIPCMRKPQAQDAGSQVLSLSALPCSAAPTVGTRQDQTLPAHPASPPTPAQLSGQKVGWAPETGQQRRRRQVPKASAMGAAGNPCQRTIPGGSRWSGMGTAKSPAGETQARPCPEGQWALCVQVRGRVRAYPQVG